MHATGQRARAFYGTPKEFFFFTDTPDGLVIPRGMRTRLIEFLTKVNIPYEIEESYVVISLYGAEKIGRASYNAQGATS